VMWFLFGISLQLWSYIATLPMLRSPIHWCFFLSDSQLYGFFISSHIGDDYIMCRFEVLQAGVEGLCLHRPAGL
jgi:hypothetical protein